MSNHTAGNGKAGRASVAPNSPQLYACPQPTPHGSLGQIHRARRHHELVLGLPNRLFEPRQLVRHPEDWLQAAPEAQLSRHRSFGETCLTPPCPTMRRVKGKIGRAPVAHNFPQLHAHRQKAFHGHSDRSTELADDKRLPLVCQTGYLSHDTWPAVPKTGPRHLWKHILQVWGAFWKILPATPCPTTQPVMGRPVVRRWPTTPRIFTHAHNQPLTTPRIGPQSSQTIRTCSWFV